jgi:hypothetical protein
MAKIFILCAGGAGAEFARCIMEKMSEQGLKPELPPSDELHTPGLTGGIPWMYARTIGSRIVEGLHLVGVDSNSTEIMELRSKYGDALRGRAYIFSQDSGMGGDWKRALEILEKNPGVLDFLKDNRIAASDALIIVCSADGGSGVGLLRFIVDRKSELVSPDTLIIPLLFLPSITDVRFNTTSARNARETLEFVSKALEGQKITFVVAFDLNDAMVKAAYLKDVVEPEYINDFISRLSAILSSKTSKEGLRVLYSEAIPSGIGFRDADHFALHAEYPLIFTAVGDLLRAPIKTISPKDIDIFDFNMFKGFVVSPGYFETTPKSIDVNEALTEYPRLVRSAFSLLGTPVAACSKDYVTKILVLLAGPFLDESVREAISRDLEDYFEGKDVRVYIYNRDPSKEKEKLKVWVLAGFNETAPLKVKYE